MTSSPFKCHLGALMWPHGTLKKSAWQMEELIKNIEYSDVLVECE